MTGARQKVSKYAVFAFVTFLVSLWSVCDGQWRTLALVDWLDVVGEGGAALVVAYWLFLIVRARPEGRVTDQLFCGLTCVFIGFWLDAMDEFVQSDSGGFMDGALESVVLPAGVLIFTCGLHAWHREQQQINRQLRNREQRYRDHTAVDRITDLGGARFLKAQLARLQASRIQQFSVLLLELDDFANFSRRYGAAAANELLAKVAELLMLNLRGQDLLCRVAGARFAVVMPATEAAQAHVLAAELREALVHYAYKLDATGATVYQACRSGLATYCGQTIDELLLQAHAQLVANAAQLKVA